MMVEEETGDRELIEAARGGDEEAFERLYLRYREYVLIIASRYGVTAAALDVLQETFLYFFRKLPEFELRARFSTFLYPVVKNLSLKKKAEASRVVGYENGGIDIGSLPSREGTEDPGARLLELVVSLPEEQKETLLLRFADGMTLGEIAAALDIPLGTVKSRLHNALAALRRQEEST
jgi:RNA polymerase sigma-70 factor (ECF subfamily)